MLSAIFFLFVATVMLTVVSILVLSEYVSKKTVAEWEDLVLREQVRVWPCWTLEKVVNDPPEVGDPIWKLAGIRYWDWSLVFDYEVNFQPGPIWMPRMGETPRRSMAPVVLESYDWDLVEDEFLSRVERKDRRERQKPRKRCTMCGSRCDHGRAQKRYGLAAWEKARRERGLGHEK